MPESSFDPRNASDNTGAEIIVIEGKPSEIPPEKRKVDPSTIWWPEGEPKPWEKDRPPEGPPSGDDSAAT